MMHEIISRRTKNSKHFLQGENVLFEAVAGTNLHYENNGRLRTVDMQPRRVDNQNFDGWRITQNGWHYAIGKPASKQHDGWVGFGAQHGRRWFQFRLRAAGHVHWPTKDYDQLAVANYDRSKLSQNVERLRMASGETAVNIGSTVLWRDVMPGVNIRWRVEGKHLKEEIIVSAASREIFLDPATPDDETYAVFLFELDTAGVAAWTAGGQRREADDQGFEDSDGRIGMEDEQGRLMAFMPLDYAFVEGAKTPTVPRRSSEGLLPHRHQIPLRKRIFRQNGKHFLVVGARVDHLKTLPAGPVIFDPTLEEQPDETDSKDASIDRDTPTTTVNGNYLLYHGGGGGSPWRRAFLEFDCSSIPATAIPSSATLGLTSYSSGASNGDFTVYSLHENVEDWEESNITWEEYKSGENWPGSDGGDTAGVDYESTALGSGQGVLTINTSFDTSLTNLTRIKGWFGASNTNYGIKIQPDSSGERCNLWSSSATVTERRPKLTIVYSSDPPDEMTAEASAVSGSVIAGAEAGLSMGSVLVASTPPIAINCRGNLFWNTQKSQLSAMLFMTYDDKWVLPDAAGTAAAEHGLTVTRYKGSIVPK